MANYLAETVETSYVQGKLARYGYREYGAQSDIPLVLLNRYKGTLDDWDPLLLDLLAKERRIITFDNVGVGYTDGTAPDTIEAMAEGAVDFLKAKGLKKVHALGWSMGGFIAQILAIEYPEYFATVTVAGSGPGEPRIRPPEDLRSVEIRSKEAPSIDDVLFLFFPDTDAGREAGLAVLGRSYHRADGVTRETKKDSWLNQGKAINRWNSGEGSAWANLPKAGVPLLVANGTHDVMEHVKQTIAMSDQIPEGVTAIFADAGHAFLFQYPERFSRLVIGFTA
ncbi:alpha/beta hydrolase [Paraburkholderia dipogonis]|uniref:Alpha/beta hydrolase n=1 Tax=Paraburkholderia dipogonis TaxID=1211383 RepID=A0A4Y8MWX9_9BURK|nr:alpha/beta hydrolase [Paraburkholderia dipogonis]TFE41919.1 alpha/beta hydrolase [Paraburkholderia dipogonis]